jgi:hypothetical protein
MPNTKGQRISQVWENVTTIITTTTDHPTSSSSPITFHHHLLSHHRLLSHHHHRHQKVKKNAHEGALGGRKLASMYRGFAFEGTSGGTRWSSLKYLIFTPVWRTETENVVKTLSPGLHAVPKVAAKLPHLFSSLLLPCAQPWRRLTVTVEHHEACRHRIWTRRRQVCLGVSDSQLCFQGFLQVSLWASL